MKKKSRRVHHWYIEYDDTYGYDNCYAVKLGAFCDSRHSSMYEAKQRIIQLEEEGIS